MMRIGRGCLAVTAGVESEPSAGLAGAGRDRAGAAEVGPGRFGAQPVGMIARRDDQDRRDVGTGPVHVEQAGRSQLDQWQ